MKKDSISTWIYIVLLWVLIIGLAVGYGYVLAVYGDKPVNEVPVWVLWLLR